MCALLKCASTDLGRVQPIPLCCFFACFGSVDPRPRAYVSRYGMDMAVMISDTFRAAIPRSKPILGPRNLNGSDGQDKVVLQIAAIG